MAYSRQHPSPRYLELIALYRRMHTEGDVARNIAPEDMFAGHFLPRQAHRIKPLILRTGARTILDYGSGKGAQYRKAPIAQAGVVRWHSIQEYWGVDSIRCYDPAYEPFSALPEGRFDGVICTDMLEHCPEQDLEWIIDGFFSFANKFVFANVACYPARKTLPNGENAHCTIQPSGFWTILFEQISAKYPGVLWELWIDELQDQKYQEVRAGNFGQAAPAQPAAPRPSVWRMV
jgi:hypothetical protein